MTFVFAKLTGPVQSRNVKLDGDITLGQPLRTNVADEGERVAELELGDGDDVALEARSSRNPKVTAVGQCKYQLLASRDGLRLEGRRSCATTRSAPVVIQGNGALLRDGAKWVK